MPDTGDVVIGWVMVVFGALFLALVIACHIGDRNWERFAKLGAWSLFMIFIGFFFVTGY